MTVSFRLGIAGLGTVGASVVRMVERRRAALAAAGLDIRVAAVSSRDRSRDRGLDLTDVAWFDDPVALARAVNGRVDLAIYSGEVTEAGRVELLPFLREQAVSITAHRFGTPNGLTEGLLSR